jgi:hypothetical protein
MKHVSLNPFRLDFYIGFGDEDWEKYAAYFNRTESLDEIRVRCDATTTRNFEIIQRRVGVWFAEGSLTGPMDKVLPKMPGVIAHEAEHVIDYLYEHIGETRVTEEIRAYLIQWVTEMMWKEWLNKRGKISW